MLTHHFGGSLVSEGAWEVCAHVLCQDLHGLALQIVFLHKLLIGQDGAGSSIGGGAAKTQTQDGACIAVQFSNNSLSDFLNKILASI